MFSKARYLLSTILAPPVYNKPTIAQKLTIIMESNRFASNADSIKVLHDPIGKEFHIEFANCRAFLQYEMEGDLLRVLHTEVPKEVGGKGYGKILAQAALQHIEKHKYRAESECDYFQYYVEKYEPKYLKYFEE